MLASLTALVRIAIFFSGFVPLDFFEELVERRVYAFHRVVLETPVRVDARPEAGDHRAPLQFVDDAVSVEVGDQESRGVAADVDYGDSHSSRRSTDGDHVCLVRHRFAVERRQQVVDREARHFFARRAGGRPDVGHDDQVLGG